MSRNVGRNMGREKYKTGIQTWRGFAGRLWMPSSPNGYIKYENSIQPKPQGVDPYTGKTLPNSQSHYPITE